MSENPRPNAAGLAELIRLTRATILQTEEPLASAFRGLDLTGWRQQRAEMQSAIDALGEQKRAADALAHTARQRLVEVNAIVTPHLPALKAMNGVIEAAREADNRIRQQIASSGVQLLSEHTRAALNSATDWHLPAYRMTALGALGVAAREAGLEELATEAASVFEGLDDTAAAAAADAAATNLDTLSPADVALGVRALAVACSLTVVLWLATGDDAWRWTLRTLLDWVGLAGLAKGAESSVRRGLERRAKESGG